MLLLLSTTSCMLDGVNGNGKVVTKIRSISEKVTNIEVDRGIEVMIITGVPAGIKVEADENLHDVITTEVHGNTLVVSARGNIYRATAKRVYVSLPKVERLEASSGGQIRSKDVVEAEKLQIKAASGGGIKLSADVKYIDIQASSGAVIRLKGRALTSRINSSSGSTVQAKDFSADRVEAAASSGSNIRIRVVKALTAHVSSGGSVKYFGNPEVQDISKSSGGSVSRGE